MRILPSLILLFGSIVVVIGCGGSSETGLFAFPDGGASTGDSGDSNTNAEKKDGGVHAPVVCGSAACGGDELCVTPCCGGVAPPCNALPASGTCPDGTSYVSWCSGLVQGPGCQDGPCTPPPPYCSKTLPDGCTEDAHGNVVCLCA